MDSVDNRKIFDLRYNKYTPSNIFDGGATAIEPQ